MSYMDQTAFAPMGGIQELSFDEIDQVGGGPGCLVVVAVIGVLALAGYLGYQDDHKDQNREDKN